MRPCSRCGAETLKVIYLGLPMRACTDDNCGTVDGVFAWILEYHFNGWFMVYEGSYASALWYWLTMGEEE